MECHQICCTKIQNAKIEKIEVGQSMQTDIIINYQYCTATDSNR